MKLAGNVACVGKMRNAYTVLTRKPQGRDHMVDLSVDGRIIVK
jgi:hypothetical protein